MYRFVLFVFFLVSALDVYSASGNGIRAAWLTTAYGLDWPKTGAANSRKEMKEILDCLASLEVNTVMFQCRIRGDVAYRSKIEPMNRIFSGFDYDPLEFVVNECHKRGMECHAWIVCLPVGNDRNAASHGKMSVIARKRNILLKSNGEWYMNPACRETADYISSIAGEIAANYMVDGIHLDYIRYPDDYRRFPTRKWAMSRNAPAERRRQITAIVSKVSGTVKAVRPAIKVSCATIGKYNDTHMFSSNGWNAYESLGQDVETWIENGYVDVVYPMIYFRDNDFYPFVADWKERFGAEKVVPGIGIYKVDSSEGDWPVGEICRQIRYCMSLGFDNIGFYRVGYLTDNTKGLYFAMKGILPLHNGEKKTVARDEFSVVGKPCAVSAAVSDGTLFLKWQGTEDHAPNVRYVLYGSEGLPLENGYEMTVVDADIRECSYSFTPVYLWEKYRWFALTAVDEAGNESSPVYISMPSNKLKCKDFMENGEYLFR